MILLWLILIPLIGGIGKRTVIAAALLWLRRKS